MDNIPYELLLIEIIDNILEKKTRKHIQYYNVVQKVLDSNRHNKLALCKYLLGRLIRESERLFYSAQQLAKRHCPACKEVQEVANEASNLEIPEDVVLH